jgi:hypothetical protein
MRTWAKRLSKIAGYGILALLLLAALGMTFTVGWRPVVGARKRPLTSRRFQPTPERMHRGEYLVRAVGKCMSCHSKYDEKARPPVLLSKEGAGTVLFEDAAIGRIVGPNITSDPETGLGKWSDDAIARAIREGIAADGSALFPVMPYEHFRRLSDEDLASIVVLLRSLPPVQSDLPPNKIPFLFARLIQAVPQPVNRCRNRIRPRRLSTAPTWPTWEVATTATRRVTPHFSASAEWRCPVALRCGKGWLRRTSLRTLRASSTTTRRCSSAPYAPVLSAHAS